MKRVVFSETIAASDLKVSRCRHIIEFMMVCEYYWPEIVYIQKFKPDFLRTYCGDIFQCLQLQLLICLSALIAL